MDRQKTLCAAALGLACMAATAVAAPPESVPLGSAATPVKMHPLELPVWKVPNLPMSGEAYYAPDSYHVIAQVQDPLALKPKDPRAKNGSLTYIFTDDGAMVRRINDRGQDACSYFFPDMQHVIWTSTRDHMDWPVGSWDDEHDYPKGAELYVSDLEGTNVRRLTDNAWYDAEVSVSPDGRWILFGRQVDGRMDLWRMRSDGTGEQQITFTDEWQEGGAIYMPDSETILFRAWKRADYGKIDPLPMTIFTIRHDGTGLTPRTFDHDMNWAPYPAPDGRHYVFVRTVDGRNREIYLGDLQGGAPVRLTWNDGFDGFPSLSPDGKKMLFTRKIPAEYGVFTYVMDVSSLQLAATRPDEQRDTARQ